MPFSVEIPVNAASIQSDLAILGKRFTRDLRFSHREKQAQPAPDDPIGFPRYNAG
jgi:hypothetical protein